MRKSKQETAKTRQNIVSTAAVEFRQRGIDGCGLSDLMAACGLTHGGFYRHFDSKNELVAEACAVAVESITAKMALAATSKSKKGGLATAVAKYLSVSHRDNPGAGCPLAALGSEIARADATTRREVTRGFLGLVDTVAGLYGDIPPDAARKRALVTVSTMIGALTVSRIVAEPQLSAEVLRSAAAHLSDVI